MLAWQWYKIMRDLLLPSSLDSVIKEERSPSSFAKYKESECLSTLF